MVSGLEAKPRLTLQAVRELLCEEAAHHRIQPEVISGPMKTRGVHKIRREIIVAMYEKGAHPGQIAHVLNRGIEWIEDILGAPVA